MGFPVITRRRRGYAKRFAINVPIDWYQYPFIKRLILLDVANRSGAQTLSSADQFAVFMLIY
jgi:hypothetical protein